MQLSQQHPVPSHKPTTQLKGMKSKRELGPISSDLLRWQWRRMASHSPSPSLPLVLPNGKLYVEQSLSSPTKWHRSQFAE